MYRYSPGPQRRRTALATGAPSSPGGRPHNPHDAQPTTTQSACRPPGPAPNTRRTAQENIKFTPDEKHKPRCLAQKHTFMQPATHVLALPNTTSGYRILLDVSQYEA